MYPLLPWKYISGALTLVTFIAVYADDLQQLTGVPVPDHLLVRYLPPCALLLVGVFFGPTSYWAPWRVFWRLIPKLNDFFPDLNGVWIGRTRSNWPTIESLVESSKAGDRTTEQELHDIPEKVDAMAIRFTSSLFRLQVEAALSSTDGESFSITAKPWKNHQTGRIHISYVYQQRTPNHAITDEETHLGAADLELKPEDNTHVSGTYWTKRAWRTGRNTAGLLDLSLHTRKEKRRKSLREYI